MDILLTGGTGYIGAQVLTKLVQGGHTVTAVVRSDEAKAKVDAAGATGLVGDLFDTDFVTGELARHDGAIHTAAGSDEQDPELNTGIIDAVATAYSGTTKPFVHTGGCWTYGTGDDLVEGDAQNPPMITSWRPAQEERLLALDVRAAVVQPGIVYGHAGGIAAMLVGGPRDDSCALVLIGPGDQHWTTVHVDDLADLYVRVLDQAATGSYLGVSGENPTVRELGEAAAREVVDGSQEEAESRLGPAFTEALLLDQQAQGAKARALGWNPSRPSLVDLLARGYPVSQ